ncbi:MAG: hypothetical protein ACTHQ3_07080 [Motilibacteraceae bacterium]
MRAGVGGGYAGEVLPAPRVDAAALWQVVLRLRQVSSLAAAASDALPTADPVWTGPAATAFGAGRDDVGQRLGLAAGVAARAAETLSAYAQVVERAQAEVAACSRELADVEAERQRRAVLVAAGLPDPGSADLDQRWRAAHARHERALEAYRTAVGAAARALDTLWGQVPAHARGMSAGDRATQGFRGFFQSSVVDPAKGVWALTGEALVDRGRWARNVAGLPAAMWDQVVHPVRTTEESLGLDVWRDDGGDWTHSLGITAGTLAGMVLGPVGKGGEAARGAEKAAERSAKEGAEHGVGRAPHQATRDLADIASLRGATPADVERLIPSNWIKSATNAKKGGLGIRYSNPEVLGEQIRIMPGKRSDPNPVKQGPYMRISRNGEVSDPIPLMGNPAL